MGSMGSSNSYTLLVVSPGKQGTPSHVHSWNEIKNQAEVYIKETMPKRRVHESTLHSSDLSHVWWQFGVNFVFALFFLAASTFLAITSAMPKWICVFMMFLILMVLVLVWVWVLPWVSVVWAWLLQWVAWKAGEVDAPGVSLFSKQKIKVAGNFAMSKIVALAWSMSKDEELNDAWMVHMVRSPGVVEVLHFPDIGYLVPNQWQVTQITWVPEGADSPVYLLEDGQTRSIPNKTDKGDGESLNLFEVIEQLTEAIKKDTIAGQGFFEVTMADANNFAYFVRIFQKPVVQVLISCFVTALNSLPVIQFVYMAVKMQDFYCSGSDLPAEASFLQESELVCTKSSQQSRCPEFCTSGTGFVHFFEAVTSHLLISEHEVTLTVVLTLVMILCFAIIKGQFLRFEESLLFAYSQSKDRHLAQHLCGILTHMQFYPWLMTAVQSFYQIANKGHRRSTRGQRVTKGFEGNSIARHRPNATFEAVCANAIAATHIRDKLQSLPFQPSFEAGDDPKKQLASVITNMRRKWMHWKETCYLNHSSTRFKLMISVPIGSYEALVTILVAVESMYGEQFDEKFFLSKKLNVPDSLEDFAKNFDQGERGLSDDLRIGNILIPKDFVLTHIQIGNRSVRIGGTAKQQKQKTAITSLEELRRLCPWCAKETSEDHGSKMTLTKQGCVANSAFVEFHCPEVNMKFLSAEHKANTDSMSKETLIEWGKQFNDAILEPEMNFRAQPSLPHNDNNNHVSLLFQRSMGGELDPHKLCDFMDENFRRWKQSTDEIKEWELKKDQISDSWNFEKLQSCIDSFKKHTGEKEVPQLYLQYSSWEDLWAQAFSLSRYVVFPQLLTIGLSVLLAFFFPLWRKYVQGGVCFPEAFGWPMRFNGLAAAVSFYWLFSLYDNECIRLELIDKALDTLSERTRKEKAGLEGEIWADEFCLYEATTSRPYLKTSQKSMAEWRKRYTRLSKNVREWAQTEDYIRYFLATARITSQAVLVAGTILLVFLLAIFMMHALHGKGMLSVDKHQLGRLVRQHTADALAAAKQAGSGALVSAQKHIEGSLQSATQAGIAKGEMLVHGHRRLSGVSFAVSSALAKIDAQALRQLLATGALSFQDPLRWQMRALLSEFDATFPRRRLLSADKAKAGLSKAAEYASAVKGIDISKATKTQAAAVAMILIILFYSVFLIVVITRINQKFDNHDQMLTHQKQYHIAFHEPRENTASKDANDEANKVAPNKETDEKRQLPASKTEDADDDANKETDEKRQLRLWELSHAFTGVKDSKHVYEQLIDTTIENSHKKYLKYPLKLFGIVITKGVLSGYIAIAMLPLVQQGWALVPSLVESACRTVENYGPFEWIDSKISAATTVVNNVADDAAQGVLDSIPHGGHGGTDDTTLVPEISIKKVFDAAVCKPLSAAAEAEAAKLTEKVEMAAEAAGLEEASEAHEPADGGRRLLLDRSLRESLDRAAEQWLASHPGHVAVQLAQMDFAFHELHNRAELLFQVIPTAVHNAYLLGGLEAALDTLLIHQAWMDDITPDFTRAVFV